MRAAPMRPGVVAVALIAACLPAGSKSRSGLAAFVEREIAAPTEPYVAPEAAIERIERKHARKTRREQLRAARRAEKRAQTIAALTDRLNAAAKARRSGTR